MTLKYNVRLNADHTFDVSARGRAPDGSLKVMTRKGLTIATTLAAVESIGAEFDKHLRPGPSAEDLAGKESTGR